MSRETFEQQQPVEVRNKALAVVFDAWVVHQKTVLDHDPTEEEIAAAKRSIMQQFNRNILETRREKDRQQQQKAEEKAAKKRKLETMLRNAQEAQGKATSKQEPPAQEEPQIHKGKKVIAAGKLPREPKPELEPDSIDYEADPKLFETQPNLRADDYQDAIDGAPPAETPAPPQEDPMESIWQYTQEAQRLHEADKKIRGKQLEIDGRTFTVGHLQDDGTRFLRTETTAVPIGKSLPDTEVRKLLAEQEQPKASDDGDVIDVEVVKKEPVEAPSESEAHLEKVSEFLTEMRSQGSMQRLSAVLVRYGIISQTESNDRIMYNYLLSELEPLKDSIQERTKKEFGQLDSGYTREITKALRKNLNRIKRIHDGLNGDARPRAVTYSYIRTILQEDGIDKTLQRPFYDAHLDKSVKPQDVRDFLKEQGLVLSDLQWHRVLDRIAESWLQDAEQQREAEPEDEPAPEREPEESPAPEPSPETVAEPEPVLEQIPEQDRQALDEFKGLPQDEIELIADQEIERQVADDEAARAAEQRQGRENREAFRLEKERSIAEFRKNYSKLAAAVNGAAEAMHAWSRSDSNSKFFESKHFGFLVEPKEAEDLEFIDPAKPYYMRVEDLNIDAMEQCQGMDCIEREKANALDKLFNTDRYTSGSLLDKVLLLYRTMQGYADGLGENQGRSTLGLKDDVRRFQDSKSNFFRTTKPHVDLMMQTLKDMDVEVDEIQLWSLSNDHVSQRSAQGWDTTVFNHHRTNRIPKSLLGLSKAVAKNLGKGSKGYAVMDIARLGFKYKGVQRCKSSIDTIDITKLL